MKKLILTSIILVLLICSCSSNAIDGKTSGTTAEQTTESTEQGTDTYVFSKQTVSYSEQNGQYSFRKDMEYTATDLAEYYFEPNTSFEDRYDCIRSTEKILSQLLNINEIPEFYIFSKSTYNDKFVSDNKLYSSDGDWNTTIYVADVLMATYGQFSHYGLVFGYANYLCDELQWTNTVNGQFTTPCMLDAFDLNLLCFDNSFISQEDVCTAQQISCDFVESYINSNGQSSLETLLSNSDSSLGMELLKDELSKYYQENGQSFSPSTIRYGYGGKSFDYIVSSDLASFYIGNEWQDSNKDVNPSIYDNFLHTNYADIKAFFEINLDQMSQYQDLFAFDNYNNDLTVVFPNMPTTSQTSYYQTNSRTIYLFNIDSLMHEYIHSLTEPNNSMQLWQVEGFARYYSYRFDSYGTIFLNYDYNNIVNSPSTLYVREYLDAIGREINISIDYTELENIAVYSRSYKDPNVSYVAGSSFIQYLVKQYGDSTIIQWIYGNGTPPNKSYEELVFDWNTYIEENYHNYSKYIK